MLTTTAGRQWRKAMIYVGENSIVSTSGQMQLEEGGKMNKKEISKMLRVLGGIDVCGNFGLSEWVELLEIDVNFSTLCDKFDVWERFTPSHWVRLLSSQPSLEWNCSKINGWGRFAPSDWVELLSANPSFASKCSMVKAWGKLETKDWIRLLNRRSEFADQYMLSHHWERSGLYEKLITHLDDRSPVTWEIYDIWFLLGVITRERNDRKLWLDLLIKYSNQPPTCPSEVSCQCRKQGVLRNLSGDEWVQLLTDRPDFSKQCDFFRGWEKFGAADWACLLKAQPQFENVMHKNDGWKLLDGNAWMFLLMEQPHLAEECSQHDGWKLFDGGNWLQLLIERPEFAGRCDEHDGWQLICDMPLEYYYGFYDCITPWARLLLEQPQFANRCEKHGGWKHLTGDDWCRLLTKHPSFSKYCDNSQGWKSLGHIPKDYYYTYPSRTPWCQLLSSRPQFEDRCDQYCGWKEFNGDDWKKLLDKQPKFLCKGIKPDGRTYFSGADCVEMVLSNPKLSDEFDKYGLWQHLDVSDWVRLLTAEVYHDKFEVCAHCDSRSQADKICLRFVKDRCALAIRFQQEDDFRAAWMEKCNEVGALSSFSGIDWQKLLMKAPWFANYCDKYDGWRKFEEKNWLLLIDGQQSFVGKCREVGGLERLKGLSENEIVAEAKRFGEDWRRPSESSYDEFVGYDD